MRLDTSERQPLDPAVLRAWRVRNLVVACAIGLAAIGIDIASSLSDDGHSLPPGLVGGILSAAAIAVAIWHASAAYRHWWVRFDAHGVELERGILVRTRTTMPFFRLQHVDTTEGPFDRAFGLTGLVLYTAAPSEKAEIPGIDGTLIDAVRQHVVERAGNLDAV